jgi:hypothetical protein
MEQMSESRRTKWAALLVLSAATVLPARAQVPADLFGAGVEATERRCSVRRGRCGIRCARHGRRHDSAQPRVPHRASPSADGRGWRKAGAGGVWRSIRRWWLTGGDLRRFDFDTGGGCYCCYSRYRRSARILIGSRSSQSSRGFRVGNRKSSSRTSVMVCCGHRLRAIS